MDNTTNRAKTLREWLDYVIGEYGWSSPAFEYVYDLMDSRGEDAVVGVPDSEMTKLLKSLNAKGKE